MWSSTRAFLVWLSALSTYAAIVRSSGHVHPRVGGFSLLSDRIAGKSSSPMVNFGELGSGMLALLPYCTDTFQISPHFFSPAENAASSGPLSTSGEPVVRPPSHITWRPPQGTDHVQSEVVAEGVRRRAAKPNFSEAAPAAAGLPIVSLGRVADRERPALQAH